MKLFIWEGDGVLQDYSSGMICAIGEDLPDALRAIEEACNYCMNSFPQNSPTEVVNIGRPKNIKRRAWTCWGGG